MRAHTPPFTKPEAAYDSHRLYNETSAIAAAQDAKHAMTDAERESKLRTVAHYIYHAKLLMDEVFGTDRASHAAPPATPDFTIAQDPPDLPLGWLASGGIPAESAYLASFGPNADIPEKSPINSRLDIDWDACFPTRAQLDAAITGKPPLEPSRICTPAEMAYLASFGPNNTAAPRDDAPPMFATLRDIPDSFTDAHGNRITRRHPMHAEALRLADDIPEDRL